MGEFLSWVVFCTMEEDSSSILILVFMIAPFKLEVGEGRRHGTGLVLPLCHARAWGGVAQLPQLQFTFALRSPAACVL